MTTCKVTPIRLSADFSTETLQARWKWHDIFKVMKGKNLQPRIFHPTRLSFRFDGEIKSFPDKQELREISTTKPTLQHMLKENLQVGNKREEKDLQKINPKQFFLNGDRININNYFKCKCIKCTNQKSKIGWADEKTYMHALPLTTSLCLTA